MTPKRHPAVREIARRRAEGDVRGSAITAPSALVVYTSKLSDADHRAFRILDRIVEHFAPEKFTWEPEHLGWLYAKHQDGGGFTVRVRERWKKPTNAQEREIARRLSGLVPTGELLAQVGVSTFRDDHRGTIEDQLPAILGYIRHHIEEGRARKSAYLLQRQQEAETAKAAAALAASARRDDVAWQRFVAAVEMQERLDRAKAMLDRATDLTEFEEIGGRSTSEWIEWLRGKIDEVDPLRDGVVGLLRKMTE